MMHLSCHTVYPHLWIVFVKSVNRHDNESHMLPHASALRPNSLLASFFVGSGLCFLRLAGNNSTGGRSSPSVASSFLRRIQSFHTSTERSKLFKLPRCDGSLSPCQATSSKYFCISCRFSVTVLPLPESTPELFARRSTLHSSSLPVVSPLMLFLYNPSEF